MKYPVACCGDSLLVASAGLGGMEMIHPLAWSVFFWIPTIFIPFLVFVWIARDTNAPPEPQTEPAREEQPRRPPVMVPIRRATPSGPFDKRLRNRRSIRQRYD